MLLSLRTCRRRQSDFGSGHTTTTSGSSESCDKDFPVGVTVHRRVGWEREEWGIGNRREASFGPFVLLAQEVSFGGIQRCVERQPQLREICTRATDFLLRRRVQPLGWFAGI